MLGAKEKRTRNNKTRMEMKKKVTVGNKIVQHKDEARRKKKCGNI